MNMDGSVNALKLVNCFHFQVMPLKTFHDYKTLRDIIYITYSDPLPYTPYLMELLAMW